MVQIVDVKPTKSLANAFGEGIEKGMNAGLSAQLQDMLEQKQMNRELEKIKYAWELENGALEKSTNRRNAFMDFSGGASNQRFVDRQEITSQGGNIPNRKTLPPGVAPMLPYENMPAIGEEKIYQQAQQFAPVKSPPQQTALENQNPIAWLNKQNDRISRMANEERAAARGRGASNKELKRITDDEKEAKIQARGQFDAMLKGAGFELERMKFESQQTEKMTSEARKAEQKNVNDFISGSQEKAKQIPYQKDLLSIAEDSIRENNFGLLSPDNLAELTHIDAFRTPEGEAFRTAVKDYFLADIKSAGGRPNMFIEKMLASILPNVGKTAEANMAWVVLQRLKIDLDQKRQDLIEELTLKHTDENGNVKNNLIDDVNRSLLEYADKRQEKTAMSLQEVKEMNMSTAELASTKHAKVDGTPLTKKRAKALLAAANGDINKAIQAAEILGYKIPDEK